MQTTRFICAAVSAVLLCGSSPAPAVAQSAPPATPPVAPITTPTKAPSDLMTPAVGPTAAPATIAPATPALDARELRARRIAHGYVVSGEALVNDPCQAARFDPSPLTMYPPQFGLVQFRSPKKMGMLCIQRLAWVAAPPRTVTSAKPPAYVTVRTQKSILRVPIR